MKKITVLLLILFSGIASSQTIIFDGNSFKNKLLQSSVDNSIAKNYQDENMKIDANNDNEISQQEAILVYKLNVSQSLINNLTGLEYFTNVRELECSQNQFQTIDVSTLIHLNVLDVSNNFNLLSIYVKNGKDEAINFGGNNPNLVYICADQTQFTNLEDTNTSGLPNYVVNDYCYIAPGGECNKITGKVIFDVLGDGIDASDVPHPNVKLKCTVNGVKMQTVTNALGDFVLYSKQTGTFNFSPEIENPDWFTLPSNPIQATFANTDNNVSNHNFFIAPVGGSHYDVEVVIVPNSFSLLGLNASYDVVLKNKGNQPHTGQVHINYDPLKLGFVNANVPLASSLGLLTYAYNGLLPFETRTFKINLSLSPLVLLNDTLEFTVIADPNGEYPATQGDNTYVYKQRVTNSNNPNSINCLEGTSLDNSEIGKYLHYNINFENTGSQVAKHVTVKTVFDSSTYNPETLQILDASIPYESRVENGELLFLFRNANLGGPGGQGAILLKIASNNDLPSGSTVSTEAEIFFDYESEMMPLVTNTDPENTTYQNLNVSINSLDSSIAVYPNPASSNITIDSDVEITSVQLYDVYGRLLQTNLTNTSQIKFDISQRMEGTYFLKITSNKGQKVEKIIKK